MFGTRQSVTVVINLGPEIFGECMEPLYRNISPLMEAMIHICKAPAAGDKITIDLHTMHMQ